MTGGRWNHIGTAMIYCGTTTSLCCLEVLVHSDALPANKVSIEIDVPDNLTIYSLSASELPPNWNDVVAPSETKQLGTDWVKSGTTAVLCVPSAVVPNERNYLLSPAHPDFGRITFAAPVPFPFDPRLK